jgi:tetratricopeptide (TPR) repeat protein
MRRFSTSSFVQVELKKFIKKPETHSLRYPKTQHARLSKPRTAYSKQHAAHLLSKITDEKVSMDSLGPTSNDDVKYLALVKDQPSIMYTILGTSQNQLLDSVVVDRTVKRFLDRDQIEKGLMMCRLAKENGIIAMNRVHLWYFQNNKINDSIELYTNRKKYGVPPNQATLTTLFDGCANAEQLTSLQVKKLERILLGVKDLVINYSHIHSAFQAMLNCEDKSIALSLFNRWKDEPILTSFKPTVQLYTILIEGLTGLNDLDVFTNVELIWERVLSVPHMKRDPILYESFVHAYLNLNRLDLVARGLDAASKYFYIETAPPKIMASKTRFKQPATELNIPQLKPIARKYHPSQRLIDMLMKTYMQLGDYSQALNIFEQFASSGRVNDLGLWNRYIICNTNLHKEHAGESSIRIYDSLRERAPKVRPNGVTRWLVFNAIYTESLTSMNDKGLYVIGSRADELFKISTGFMDRFREKSTAQELDGYLKSVKRLRLTREQRQSALDLIESKKSSFRDELKISKNREKHREYIKSVTKTEEYLRRKQEMKKALA